MKRLFCYLACAWIPLIATPAAQAADIAAAKPLTKEPAAIASPWQFQFTPYVWTIFVKGDQRLGNSVSHIDTNIFELFNKTDHLYAWMSYQELRNGPLAFYANVVWSRMGVSDTKSGIFPIGPLNTSANVVARAKIWFDLAIIEPGITYEFARWGAPGAAMTSLDLVAGARYWFMRPDLDLSVSASVNIPALGISRSGAGHVSGAKTIDWVDPLAGLRLRHQFSPDQELVLQGDVGGFGVGSDLSWHALGTYNFRTSVLGHQFNAYVGYRALSIDYEQGSGNRKIGLDMVTHGPVTGMTYKW